MSYLSKTAGWSRMREGEVFLNTLKNRPILPKNEAESKLLSHGGG